MSSSIIGTSSSRGNVGVGEGEGVGIGDVAGRSKRTRRERLGPTKLRCVRMLCEVY